jgi:single-strand DNA-binding protein
MAYMFGMARLGRDAELRTTGAGDTVTSLSLAFSSGKKGQDGHRVTTWVDASLWGRRAEALAPYLLKGTSVACVVEDIVMERYVGRNGEGTKLTGRIVSIELGGSAPHREEEAQAPAAAPRAPAAAPYPQSGRSPARAALPPAAGGGASGFDDMADDDIPF